MTVNELIEILKGLDGDAEVMTSASSHDYWGSVLANEVHDAELQDVKYSDYHRTYKIANEDEGDYENDGLKQVVVIS